MCLCVFLAVSLTVPQDAFTFTAHHHHQQLQQQQQQQRGQQMFVGVSRDDTHRPKLTGQFAGLCTVQFDAISDFIIICRKNRDKL